MKKKFLIVLLAFAAVVGTGYAVRSVLARRTPAAAGQARGWHCPMHRDFHSDKPGSCPICSMTLVRDDEAAEPAPAYPTTVSSVAVKRPANARKICVLHHCTMSQCVMELTVEAGKEVVCPLCGEAEAAELPAHSRPLYYRNPMNPAVTSPTPMKDSMGMDYIPVYPEEDQGGSVPGQGSVTLTEERRRQIGLESEPVKRRDLAVVVRATGQVAYDPDLYHAINEYAEAVKAREAVKESPYPDVHQRADALVQASDMRLRQMGLSQEQIRRIESSTQPPTNLLFGGPGGTVWVYAQIYEYEIPLVKPGQSVVLKTLAYPGRKFRGTVRSIDPIVSAETRSLRARIEVPNPEGLLTLQLYMDAEIHAELGRELALPTTALIDTGARKLAFVDLGGGRLEPREVQVGRQAEGYYELLSGVKEGERVVTSANFLIDSESKLKSVVPEKGR